MRDKPLWLLWFLRGAAACPPAAAAHRQVPLATPQACRLAPTTMDTNVVQLHPQCEPRTRVSIGRAPADPELSLIVSAGECLSSWSGRPGSLLTLAPHRSGRAGSAASGSSTDSFATRGVVARFEN